jgi:catechol 2,3-dioxygenase-like lactoylglutathione lyase family enzyme
VITSGLVNLFAADIERSLAFYQGVLGLPETFRTPTVGIPEHVEMAAGGFVLAVSSAAAAERVHGIEPEPGRPAMSLVFWVEDVDSAFRHVTEAGGEAVTEPHDTGNGNRNAVTRDPDGTLVEIVGKRA